MSRFETVDRSNWEEFLGAEAAVLVLGKSDCDACNRWSEELKTFLETDEQFKNVRFGKLLLDQPGLVGFKRANPWLAQVDVLPYNLIYKGGEKQKEFAGLGMDRLTNRLNRILGN